MARELEQPLTRGQLNRLLIGNALTKPWPNILVPALIAVAGVLLGLPAVVIPVAVVAWLAFAAITYFDEDEATEVAERARAGRRPAIEQAERVDLATLAPPIADHLGRVLDQERRIRQAIERAELPFEEVSREVDTFVRAAERAAARAQLLYEYLVDEDRERVASRLRELEAAGDARDPSKRALAEALTAQLEGIDRAGAKLDGFYTEMERIAVELGNVRGQLLSVSAASEAAAQRELAADVRTLREEMGAVAAGMSEVIEETGSPPA
jgi:hypothetical protein